MLVLCGPQVLFGIVTRKFDSGDRFSESGLARAVLDVCLDVMLSR